VHENVKGYIFMKKYPDPEQKEKLSEGFYKGALRLIQWEVISDIKNV